MIYEATKKIMVRMIMLMSFCVVTAIICTGTAYADITTHTFPDSTNLTYVENRNILDLSYENLTNYEWHGVNGKTEHDYLNESPGLTFMVPMDGTTTYNNCLDLYFNDVGQTWNGRSLNAQVHFDSVRLVEYEGHESDMVPICFARNNSSLFAIYSKCNLKAKFTVTVTYADTGEVLELPMLQALYDIDIIRKPYPVYAESWTLSSGYTGDLWVWDTFKPTVSENKIAAAQSHDYTGDDSWLMCGGVAPTTGGKITMIAVASYDVSSSLQLSLANDKIDDPVKESNAKEISEQGDKIDYTVKQKMGVFYGDTMYKYSSFVMEDVIPNELIYKGAKVYDGDGTDITSKGRLEYDDTSRKLTFTFGNEWISDIDNYNGQEITMKISTTVDALDKPKVEVSNTETTIIDGNMSLSSNTVADTLAIPYKVKYRYESGTKGMALPAQISTQTGTYAIKDDSTYYEGNKVTRKASPAEGAKLKLYDEKGNFDGYWVLHWDKMSQIVESEDVVFTGTWTYTKAPRLVVIKELPASTDFAKEHGEPTFLFKITGKQSGDTWYRSITFSNTAVSQVKENGTYKDAQGTQFVLEDDQIHGTCEAVSLPEDEYVVKELSATRYKNASVIARYHGETTKVIDRGQQQIVVPMDLDSYAQHEGSIDYASVCFSNAKSDWSKYSHTDTVINKLLK